MKLKELLEKHQDLELTEEQEKEIKKFLNIKDSKKWKPKKNEEYWYVDSFGDTAVEISAEDSEDEYKIFTNNCFETEKEANFRLEQINVYNKLKNFADENNDEIDWNDLKQKKWHLNLIYPDMKLDLSYCSLIDIQGTIYFTSEELAKQAIKKVGENRIKKYLFGVE